MLRYIKSYRKIIGGKWYKARNRFGITYYTRKKPKNIHTEILYKYRY